MTTKSVSGAAILIVTALAVPASGSTPPVAPATVSSATPAARPDAWGQLLARRVHAGRVDYAALPQEPLLGKAVRAFAQVGRDEVAKMTKGAKIAFYANGYNAFTLAAIAEKYPDLSGLVRNPLYPAKSIRQIRGVWTDERWEIGGEKLSLEAIEHKVLRPLGEPRIHFAIVCASVGCPPLRSEPYAADRLEAQLDDQVRAFLSDATKFRLDRSTQIAHLSPIFDWFAEDFAKSEGVTGGDKVGGVRKFLARHLPPADAAFLLAPATKIELLDYDWSLNGN